MVLLSQARAGDRLADGWLTAKVQAKFFADDDIKARYIDVATRLLNADGTLRPELYLSHTLHLNDQGNAIWGAAIKAALMPLEAGAEAR